MKRILPVSFSTKLYVSQVKDASNQPRITLEVLGSDGEQISGHDIRYLAQKLIDGRRLGPEDQAAAGAALLHMATHAKASARRFRTLHNFVET